MDKDAEAGITPSFGGGAFRLLWMDSNEYKSWTKFRSRALLWTTIAMLLVFALLIVAAMAGVVFPWQNSRFVWLYFLGLVVGAYYAVAAAVGYQRASMRRLFLDRLTYGMATQLQKEEGELAEQAVGGQLDLPSLWAATQKRIDFYHQIATSQAERSFKVGQIAAIAGFLVVIGLGAVAAFAVSGTASIAAAAVGVAGAAMSGYIGATFMKAQSEASAQLRQFFLQPVEFARLLGAERLISTLPDAHKAASVQQIVATMMPGLESDRATAASRTDAAGSTGLNDAAQDEEDTARRSKWSWAGLKRR